MYIYVRIELHTVSHVQMQTSETQENAGWAPYLIAVSIRSIVVIRSNPRQFVTSFQLQRVEINPFGTKTFS